MVDRRLCASLKETSPASLRIWCIDNLDDFNAIEPQWRRLIEESKADPVFLSHVWLSTWWECFGADHSLYIVLASDGDRLIGAAPMMQTVNRIHGMPLRTLHAIYNYHTPRFDFPVAERQEEVYAAIWKELSRHDGDWDAVILAQAPDDSPVLPAMERIAADDGWLIGQWAAQPSPVIRLGCDYETVLGRLKGKERYSLRKRFSRLCEMGTVELEIIHDQNQVREVMPDVLRIEAAAWKGANGTAMNCDGAVSEFYARLAERTAALGWLQIYFLRLGGERVAVNYSLHKNRIIYAVKIGYDPSYHTYSPGHLLLQQVLQRVCSEGYLEYDFLGADDEWKYVWTQDVRPHRWLFLFRNRFWPRLIHRAKFGLLPRVKRSTILNRTEKGH